MHRRDLAVWLLLIVLTAIATSAGWALTVSPPTSSETPRLPQVADQLQRCAEDPANHPVAACDALAEEGLAALTRAVEADGVRASGHRQRYLATLADHYARPQCTEPQNDRRALCRTDYLDLAVMLRESAD